MLPTDAQMADWIVTLTGYALYLPVIFFCVEAIKQWIPEGMRMKVLPPISMALGALIVTLPSFLPNTTVEMMYRGLLAGAVLTGFISWKHSVSEKGPSAQ